MDNLSTGEMPEDDPGRTGNRVSGDLQYLFVRTKDLMM